MVSCLLLVLAWVTSVCPALINGRRCVRRYPHHENRDGTADERRTLVECRRYGFGGVHEAAAAEATSP